MKVTSFPFLFRNVIGTSYLEDYFLFLFLPTGGDSFGVTSQGSIDVSLFTDLERLSQEFRQFQSTIGQNVRDLTSSKMSFADELERLADTVNELQELVF